MSYSYLDLSNRPYLKKLPDLSQIDPVVNVLRLTALYLHDIAPLEQLVNLRKLNISYTYVQSLPNLPQLEELCMVEVNLTDHNDLAKCPKLRKLKVTTDDINLTMPLQNLEVLHCAVVTRPDLLYQRFPNLKELRFEHVHPKQRTHQTQDVLTYYQNLKYTRCETTKTVIQEEERSEIDEFDDWIDENFSDFNLQDHLVAFSEGRLEYTYICKNISHLDKRNIHTMRTGDRMNIYDYENNVINSYERTKDHTIVKTLPDDQYMKLNNHYGKCTIYYDPEDPEEDKYNGTDSRVVILKKIMINNYQLNDEINTLINNFSPKKYDDWLNEISVDKLISDIKNQGLTEELKKKVEVFDRYPHKTNNIVEFDGDIKDTDEGEDDEEPETQKRETIKCGGSNPYTLNRGESLKPLTVDEIKDVLWYGGRKYLLTPKQKQQFVDFIKSENKETESFIKNLVWARFVNGKMLHFRTDEEGNEIPVDISVSDEESEPSPDPDNVSTMTNPSSSHPNEESDSDSDTSNEDCSDNLVKIVSVPPQNHRTNYTPRTDRFNNIFMEDALLVADDIEIANDNMGDLLDHEKFMKLNDIIPNKRTTYRSHLDFYGKAANFSKDLIENSNGYIMLGTSGDEGSTSNIDALLDKSKDHLPLELNDVYFVFKNRLYCTVLGDLDDYTDDVQILNSGEVGWGGTFYPFDVILEPHPNVILEKSIDIYSPLNKTANHDHVYRCCPN